MSAPQRGLPPQGAMPSSRPPHELVAPPMPPSNPRPPPPPLMSQSPQPPPPSHHQVPPQPHLRSYPPSASTATASASPSSLGQLPPPPQWQQVTEESVRAWLMVKAEEEKRRQEEEKRRQEEEKTRQEDFRLQQRRVEHEILQTSLRGGVPPPLIASVIGGGMSPIISQAVLEWAQQYLASSTDQHTHAAQRAAVMIHPSPLSPDHPRRSSQPQAAYGHYPGSASGAPGPSPGGGMSGYPASPSIARGLGAAGSGPHGRPLSVVPPHLLASHPAPLTHALLGPPLAPHQPGASQAAGLSVTGDRAGEPPEEEAPSLHHQPPPLPPQQQLTSISFHHWQPPTTTVPNTTGSQTSFGGLDQPGSASGESPRKRKAPSSQSSTMSSAIGGPGYKSPTFLPSSGPSNPPPSRRRGHLRHQSEVTAGRRGGGGRGRSDTLDSQQHQQQQQQQQQQQPQQHHFAPLSLPSSLRPTSGPSTSHESGEPPPPPSMRYPQPALVPAPAPTPSSRGGHSVSSLLSSDHPPISHAVASSASAVTTSTSGEASAAMTVTSKPAGSRGESSPRLLSATGHENARGGGGGGL